MKKNIKNEVYKKKGIHKFLGIVAIFIIIILIILLIVNSMFVSTTLWQNTLTDRELVKFGINDEAIKNKDIIKFEPMGDNLQITNFGSSHGRASFDYEAIEGIEGFNFGLSSQTLTYDLQMLKQYNQEIEEGAIAIFPISYFSIYWDELEDIEKFEQLNTRYYDILDWNNIQNVDLGRYILNKISPILVTEDINLESIREAEGNLNIYNEKWYTDITERTDESIVESSKGKADNHKEIMSTKKSIPEIDPRMEEAFDEIVKYCEMHDITPIFITTPFYYTYNEEFSSDFYNTFYNDIEKLAKENNVHYIDYSHDSEFTYDKSLFSDPDHLNKKGAQKFTLMVLEDIEEITGIELS